MKKDPCSDGGAAVAVSRRFFLKKAALIWVVSQATPLGLPTLFGQSAPPPPPPDAALEGFETSVRLTGWVQGYLKGVTEQWLKVAPASNPAILGMFRDRDRQPLREMVPWAGEFAGKYLTSATQVYRMTGDPALKSVIADFVTRLAQLQAENGYLGPWPKDSQLTGHAPNTNKGKGEGTWDAWGHYHAMLGLLLWYETSHDEAALATAQRIGDLICTKFSAQRLVDTGSTEMNLAPIHSLCLLYRKTGDKRYLQMAEKIRDEFSATDAEAKPLAGNYLKGPLAGKEFSQLPKPRWEGLHSIQGLAQLGEITGDQDSRLAFEKIWWSIVQWDRHNNGGFSSGEKACGNPYDRGAIETCCTIAWTALSVDMLRLTGNSIVADELELSALNSIIGLHSPNGRWVTYNTPMDGVRKASAHSIVFQSREGSPELNCCSVNGARGLGMIADWALLSSPEGVSLSWYGPGQMTASLQGSGMLSLQVESEYPRDNKVRVKIGPGAPVKLALKLRIPHWSATTRVRLNGLEVSGVEAGRYLVLNRTWTSGDTIDLEFDFSLQYWVGEREYEGKVSIFRGPILLTYDRRFNTVDPDKVPALTARGLQGRMVEFQEWLPPMMLMEFKANDGSALRLCDFASAGTGGSPYLSWLDVQGCSKTEFSATNPRRTNPVD
jgi:hypothetical protein